MRGLAIYTIESMINDVDLKKEFEKVRDIPYRIALSPDEVSDDCLGKAQKLFKILEESGYEVRYRLCKIRWSTMDLPKEVDEKPHDDDCSHAYLEVRIDGQWKLIDATWDRGLGKIFHINEWGEEQEMAIPCLERMSPEESVEHIKHITTREGIIADLEESGEFYRALNDWLEKCREAGKGNEAGIRS